MKLSLIMVKPVMPLRMLDSHELEVLSRVLFWRIRGLNEKHTKRWRRIWAHWFKHDDVMQFYPVVERHGAFHAMHMATETELFAHQDGFDTLNGFRFWLKTGAAFGQFEASGGHLVFVPHSLSYEECSDDEMREFHDDALAFLRTPAALQRLWPAMSPADRVTTLELVLAGDSGEVPPPRHAAQPESHP